MTRIDRWSAALLVLSACSDAAGTGGGGGSGGAGGGGGHGAGGEDPGGPRVALRVTARADVIQRDERLLRVAVPLDDDLATAEQRSSWTITTNGAPISLAAGTLFVFPAIDDLSRAGAAVWLLPEVDAGDSAIEVSLGGRAIFQGTGAETDALAALVVAPIVVRTPEGEGPTQSDASIAERMRAFSSMLEGACNIHLEIESPASISVSGFGALEESDFVSVDDADTLAALRDATREPVGLVVSDRMKPLYDAIDMVRPSDPSVVPAIVLARHQSTEQASTITPAYFHSDAISELYGIAAYYGGPTLPFYWFDPDKSLEEQTLLRMTEGERERTFAVYFGEDHLQAFAHELGHLLGLPHPQDSSVIDAADGSAANLMGPADECLPDCGARISPQQCEIMLLGLTHFLE